MKKTFFTVIVLMFVVFPAFISAQDNTQVDQMKAYQEYMTPGQVHQMLAKGIGEWKTDIKMWMDPSQPPTSAEGTAVMEALLDGRYFQTKHTSVFMGMPFNGIEISGYDNAKKTFFTTWIDNFGTGIMYLEGKYDEASKTITYKGTSTDAMAKENKVRETVKLIDNDNILFEMFMGEEGKDFKTMEIKMTRKKA